MIINNNKVNELKGILEKEDKKFISIFSSNTKKTSIKKSLEILQTLEVEKENKLILELKELEKENKLNPTEKLEKEILEIKEKIEILPIKKLVATQNKYFELKKENKNLNFEDFIKENASDRLYFILENILKISMIEITRLDITINPKNDNLNIALLEVTTINNFDFNTLDFKMVLIDSIELNKNKFYSIDFENMNLLNTNTKLSTNKKYFTKVLELENQYNTLKFNNNFNEIIENQNELLKIEIENNKRILKLVNNFNY